LDEIDIEPVNPLPTLGDIEVVGLEFAILLRNLRGGLARKP
jgi:hypothetical protein